MLDCFNDSLMEIIYHGNCEVVKRPEIRIGKFTKDFGAGFYCTKFLNQAQAWARRRGTIKGNSGIVSCFQWDKSLATQQLKVCTFTEMTNDWLNFIANCRLGLLHNFDIVEGPMADDQVYNYVNNFIEGELSREDFWRLCRFKKTTHQIAFCTDKALGALTLLEVRR